MLLINGLKFAKNNAEVIDSLFQGSTTAHGIYKVRRGRGRVAIELRSIQGEPMALISPDGVFVTAHKDGGKTRYMYAMSQQTAEWLQLQGVTCRQQFDIAVDALAFALLTDSFPQEHPRADCEGCNKADCPCNA
jgi:hypothetical protein